jgi:glucose-6-phosphate 1-dehydrogenase
VRSIQITMAEDFGVEDRGQFNGYLSVPGVSSGSTVETFVAVKMAIGKHGPWLNSRPEESKP